MSGGQWLDPGMRAILSGGQSSDAVRSAVAGVLRDRGRYFNVLVDLGCGRGDSARSLNGLFGMYVGCDVVKYGDFPERDSIQFRLADLNHPPYAVDNALADAVVSIETIEHLENPRSHVREMVRIARPGGLIVVTTPNQLSLTSKSYLVARNQFHAFQEAPGFYPAHITALLEEDLKRIARECGLIDIQIRYTDRGRVPFTRWSWPRALGARGRWFSDNIVLAGRRP
jgi:SAM-dependent methyltransferase